MVQVSLSHASHRELLSLTGGSTGKEDAEKLSHEDWTIKYGSPEGYDLYESLYHGHYCAGEDPAGDRKASP